MQQDGGPMATVTFGGYTAKDPNRKRGSLLGSAYWFLKSRVVYDSLLQPYGVWRHRVLLATCDRTQRHTYTCFRRSPTQLEALVGPVYRDFLGGPSLGRPLEILVLACSNGAEAYTLASVLTKSLPGVDFRILAADLHEEMIEIASRASYSPEEALQSQFVTPEFVADTFDLIDGRYVVKPELRARVTFRQANLLSEDLHTRFGPADIVTAQNVLFHLAPADAEKAFGNIVRLLRPRAALFIDGMDQTLRIAVTEKHGLQPLPYKRRKIYEEIRVHTPIDWWRYYWGSEPYSRLRTRRSRRYGTIFLKR
jgi:chemotaxis methyl-accepting protein methylase